MPVYHTHFVRSLVIENKWARTFWTEPFHHFRIISKKSPIIHLEFSFSIFERYHMNKLQLQGLYFEFKRVTRNFWQGSKLNFFGQNRTKEGSGIKKKNKNFTSGGERVNFNARGKILPNFSRVPKANNLVFLMQILDFLSKIGEFIGAVGKYFLIFDHLKSILKAVA